MSPSSTSNRQQPRRLHRWLRLLLSFVIAVLSLLALALAIVLLVEPVRNRILDEAIVRGDKALPGAITAGEARWPSPDRILLRDFLWTDQGDTLLAAVEIETSVRVSDLLRRSLSLREVAVRGLVADVLAIQRQFPESVEESRENSPSRSFPKEGALAGVPSFGVDRFSLDGSRIRMTETLTLKELRIVGSVNLLSGDEPAIQIDSIQVRSDDDPSWAVHDATFRLDPVRARLTGNLNGAVSGKGIHLAVEAPSDAHFWLNAEGEDRWDLHINGSLPRRGLRPTGLEATGHLTPPSMEGLRAYPALAEALRDLPDLPLPRILFHLSAATEAETTAFVSLDLEPTDWIESGKLRGRIQGGTTLVDSLVLVLDGLQLTGSAELSPNRMDAAVHARASGTGWLTRIRPEITPPDALALDLRAELHGNPTHPTVSAGLLGSVSVGGRSLSGIDFRADVPPEGDMLLAGSAELEDFMVRMDAAVARGNTLIFRLAPITIREERAGVRTSREPRTGRVRYNSETGAMDVHALQITGALGQLTVNGIWTREKTGTFEIDSAWPDPPVPLRRLLAARGMPVDSLRQRWIADGPFEVRLSGSVAPRGRDFRVVAGGEFRLPGPRTLRSFLPRGAQVEDLGSIQATMALDMITAQAVPDGRFDFDLTPTDWIEAGRIRVRARNGRAEIDSLGLRLEGLAAEARGWFEADALAVQGGVDLADARFLNRWLPAKGDTLDTAGEIRFSAAGSPRDPHGEMSLSARGAYGNLVVEGLRGTASRNEEGVHAEIENTAPIRSGGMVLNRLRATVSASPSLDTFEVMLDASADEFAVYQASRFQNGDLVLLDVDTLRVRLQDQNLINRSPFRLKMDPISKRIDLDGFRMDGSLGFLEASGFASLDTTDLRARAVVDFPDRPEFISVPDHLWPRRLEAAVRALGRDVLEASALVTGLSLPGSGDVSLRFAGEGKGRRLSGHLEVEGDGHRLVLARIQVPGRISLYPFATAIENGPLRGGITLDRASVPLPIDTELEETPVGRVSGRILLAGTADNPQAAGTISLEFPDWPELSRHAARLQFLFRGDAPTDTTLREEIAPELADAGAGLGTRFEVRRGERVLLDGHADLPLSVSLLAAKAAVPEGVPVDVRIEAKDFPLVDLNPFLPANAGVEGTCTLRLHARGSARDPILDGLLRLRKAKLSLADGSRAAANGDLTFAGTGQRPSVRGRIEVESGIIRVPEQQRLLLPASGPSKLWELEEYRPELGDSAAVRGSATAPTAPPMDLDVTVTIPSGLWIQGRGLEVELAGDLNLSQRESTPTVNGELKAVRGHLAFLGRQFTVDRGIVTFYGGDTIDPTLDLLLSARVASETIRILFRGTAQDPRLTLESDSGLNEGDILAMILFGAPLDQLDSSQTGSVAGEVAKSIAASQLEASVANQLGVDILTIRQGRSEQESLIIGKYITRRALLKYEQALRSTSTFFLNLEYFLTRTIKLETLSGSDSQSAIEVNWSRDY